MVTAASIHEDQSLAIDVKSENSLLNKGLLYLLFLPLPLVDSLNGVINGGGNEGVLSLGMAYRVCIIFYCCFVILRGVITKRSLVVFITVIVLIVLPHVFDFSDASFLSLAIKSLLPVFCIEAFIKEVAEGRFRRREFIQLIDAWSVLFPLAILIPFVLGLGFQTYGSEDVGYKGFFYAQNDLCFALSVLFFFCCWKVFRKKASIPNVAKLLLVGICIALLGLKSGYLLLCVSAAYWLMRSRTPFIKRAGVAAALCIAVLAISPFVSDAVSSILDRWTYFSSTADSFTDFLSSGRLERIPIAIDYLFSSEQNPVWFVFGVGMRYSVCLAPYGLIEMDLFDLFFQFGALGAVFLLAYYLFFLFVRLPKDDRHLRFVLLMAVVLSVLAGHILNSALSAMVFSALCGLIWSARMDDKRAVPDASQQ